MPLLDPMCRFIKATPHIVGSGQFACADCCEIHGYPARILKDSFLGTIMKNIPEAETIGTVDTRDEVVSFLPSRLLVVRGPEASEVDTVELPPDTKAGGFMQVNSGIPTIVKEHIRHPAPSAGKQFVGAKGYHAHT